MARIRFQNGAEAPSDLLLDEEIDDGASASDTKKRLDELAHIYGTVEGAVAWLDGTDKPKSLAPVEATIPPTSRLQEKPPTAPPAPEVEALEVAAAEEAAAAEMAAEEKAVEENLAAHAAAAAKAEKESASKKKSDG